MNSLKSILSTLVAGAALMSASLAVQSSPAITDVVQNAAEQEKRSASPPAAGKACKHYRWVRVGHPGKGYVRRVCVDKKQRGRN